MAASPLSFLRKGPPPPRVALLRDAVFFSRTIAVPAGASRAEVVSQVGIALDAVVKNFGVTADAVLVEIVETSRDNKAKGGVLFSER